MITFAPAQIAMFQNPVCGFLAAVAGRCHATKTRAALSRLSLPDKSTSLCSRKNEDPELRVSSHAVVRPQTAATPSDVNIDDWHIMFRAVTERLTGLIGGDQGPAASTDIQASQNADRLRAEVLDCVDALERLRRAMTREPLPRRAAGSGVSP
jgi:hypothetical protein